MKGKEARADSRISDYTCSSPATTRASPCRRQALTGYMADVRPLVARAWAGVVPLRIGGGTRLKILEAMALGTPVVATSKGAEGLDVCHGKHDPSPMGLIADEPAEFAEQVVRLLRDADLRAELTANGLRLVAERYDWAAVMPRFLALVEQCV